MYKKRIGIDIMGVILPKAIETGTVEDFLACSALPNAIDSIKKLVKLYKPENIFIISKCPEFAEKVIARWFDEHDFFAETNFRRSNIYFCREQDDKAPIAEKLQLTYFIDDKTNVLDFMKNIVPNRIQLVVEFVAEVSNSEDGIIYLNNWPSVLEYITKSQ